MDIPPATLRFVVPGHPVGKKRPRVTKLGHAFTPKETVEYETRVRLAGGFAVAEWIVANREPWNSGGEYMLMVEAFSERTAVPDADNVFKSVSDALNKVVWADDVKVGGAFPPVRIDRLNPRTEVTIWRTWSYSGAHRALSVGVRVLDAAGCLLKDARQRAPLGDAISRFVDLFALENER